MANNLYQNQTTVIPDTETAEIYSLNIYAFKSAKFLVSVVDETNELIKSFETFVSYKKQPSLTALSTESSVIGDVIGFTYSVAFIPAVLPTENDRITLNVLNESGSELKVYVGEIERVE